VWISRKKYKNLLARVEALEKATRMKAFSGKISAWAYDGDLPINLVVEVLAEEAGIILDRGYAPRIVKKISGENG
jgi:hypothetical protein